MSDTPCVGVIGTGYWGKNLLRNFDALGALAAFCDQDAGRREAFTAQYPGATPHEDMAALLADPAVEAVVIATPAETHGDLVAQALAADRHVFVEKPLCLDLDQAEGLKAEAARRGRVLMVGHLLLYHPAFQTLLARVRAGDLGELRYLYSNRLSLGKIRREENALWSFAPHDISMILQIAGAMPEEVVATGGQYLHPGIADTTLSHLRFPGNVQAHVYVSWLHPFKDQRLVVIGDKAMLVFDDVMPAPDKLLLYRHGLGWDGDLPVVSKAEAEPIAFEAIEPLRNECRTFLDAVAGGLAPISDAEEGIRVLRVLDACQRAIVAGCPIPLEA